MVLMASVWAGVPSCRCLERVFFPVNTIFFVHFVFFVKVTFFFGVYSN